MTVTFDPIVAKIVFAVGLFGCLYFPVKIGVWLGNHSAWLRSLWGKVAARWPEGDEDFD